MSTTLLTITTHAVVLGGCQGYTMAPIHDAVTASNARPSAESHKALTARTNHDILQATYGPLFYKLFEKLLK